MEKYLKTAKEIIDTCTGEERIKEFRLCLRRMTKKEQAECRRYHMEKYHKDFCDKMKNDLNFKAKVIAAYVRDNMEDFHCEHLSDSQMKELNPLIRNAIYTALTDIEEDNLIRAYMIQKVNLPEYWEDCVYVDNL